MSSNPKELKVPTVHLNGSGFENLHEQYLEGVRALNEALDKIPVPHARDYYVQEDGAFEEAREQFHQQRAKVKDVLDELRAIYREIARQQRGAA